MKSKRLLKIINICVVMAFVPAISGCNPNVNYSTGTNSLGHDYTVSINGIEHHYLDHNSSVCNINGELFGISLGAMATTTDESLIEADAFTIYRAHEANGYEVLVRLNKRSGEKTLMLVRLSDFSSVTEMMSFFGIESADDIVSCSFFELAISKNTDNNSIVSCYEVYNTSESATVRRTIFDILSQLSGDDGEKKDSFLLCGCNVVAEDGTENDSGWAERIRRIDIEISSGIVLPIGIFLPIGHMISDGYIEVLNTENNFRTKLSIDLNELIKRVA